MVANMGGNIRSQTWDMMVTTGELQSRQTRQPLIVSRSGQCLQSLPILGEGSLVPGCVAHHLEPTSRRQYNELRRFQLAEGQNSLSPALDSSAPEGGLLAHQLRREA